LYYTRINFDGPVYFIYFIHNYSLLRFTNLNKIVEIFINTRHFIRIIDTKEKLLVGLLIVAILFSVVSITFAVSTGLSPLKFSMVRDKGEAPVANVFLFIESPEGVENGVQ